MVYLSKPSSLASPRVVVAAAPSAPGRAPLSAHGPVMFGRDPEKYQRS